MEQLAALRAVPHLAVIRPADPNEASEAWAVAVQHDGPTVLVLTRQAVPHLDRSAAKDLESRAALIFWPKRMAELRM